MVGDNVRAKEDEMPSECEDAGHQAEDDDKPVREYRVEHRDDPGEYYPSWLCDACAEELEECGAVIKEVAPRAVAPG